MNKDYIVKTCFCGCGIRSGWKYLTTSVMDKKTGLSTNEKYYINLGPNNDNILKLTYELPYKCLRDFFKKMKKENKHFKFDVDINGYPISLE